ncbi:branched-chain amino acid ABC transporter permease [Pinisolibacter sp. B13]|nr:branched-chain amino acid ABC transporter permease [Pinisolibacter aquiterrae]
MPLLPTSRADAVASAKAFLGAQSRVRPLEIAFWLLAFAALFVGRSHHLLLAEITILALFAVSLDLILGYAGIVSLGHAAFFGLGAYAAGILAQSGHGDPLSGLVVAAGVAAVAGFVSSFLVLRGADLTRLMITLGVASLLYEAANKMDWLTGGADGLQGILIGPLLGRFDFDLYGTTAFAYALGVLFVVMLALRVVVHSPFGHALRAIRDNRLRARAVGIPVERRLVAVYTLSAAIAGLAGALSCQTTAFVSLDVLDFHRSAEVLLVLVIGGSGRLYGAIVGAVVFRFAQDVLSAMTPQYWQFWVGLGLVILVLIGRDRLDDLGRAIVARILPARRSPEGTP